MLNVKSSVKKKRLMVKKFAQARKGQRIQREKRFGFLRDSIVYARSPSGTPRRRNSPTFFHPQKGFSTPSKVVENKRRKWIQQKDLNVEKPLWKRSNATEDAVALEKKWFSVTEALRKEVGRESVCRQAGVASRTLERWISKSKAGTLRRKSGSGRQPERKLTKGEIKRFENKVVKKKFAVTIRQMVLLLKQVTDGFGNLSLVQKILKNYNWKVCRLRTKPVLSREQMEARYEFAREHKNNPFGSRNRLWIDVDEKWFYAKKLGKRLYIPPSSPYHQEKR